MSLYRRRPIVEGCVNFPVDDERYTDTKEGGMFVRLVVEDYDLVVCAGGYQQIEYDEVLVGTDKGDEIFEHFPHMEDKETSTRRRLVSVDYACIITLGSTGWSGWNEEENRTFICTYEDLTESGKELYHMIRRLYPNGTIVLQTWLDT